VELRPGRCGAAAAPETGEVKISFRDLPEA
jgi:hypothetical protein